MHRLAIATVAVLLTAAFGWAQEQTTIPSSPANVAEGPTVPSQKKVITIPAGTRIPLSLITSIHLKSARRGDLVHLETVYPVVAGEDIAIPTATYIEGVIDKVKNRSTGNPNAALEMHFTILRFANGREVRLNNAILQAQVGRRPDTAAMFVESVEPVAFMKSVYASGSNAWAPSPMGFQAQGKPPKPPKHPKPPKGPEPEPGPTPTPSPIPSPTPSPTPTPTPTPTPPPTPPPTPTPTPIPTPPTIPTPTPTPSPTISGAGSGTGVGVGIGIAAVAAVIGGVWIAKHQGVDTVIEEGTRFYMVLQNPLSFEMQEAAEAEK